jgi:hypothetical protein
MLSRVARPTSDVTESTAKAQMSGGQDQVDRGTAEDTTLALFLEKRCIDGGENKACSPLPCCVQQRWALRVTTSEGTEQHPRSVPRRQSYC